MQEIMDLLIYNVKKKKKEYSTPPYISDKCRLGPK